MGRGKMFKPGERVLLTGYNPPRHGEVIRVCEYNSTLYWVNVEGYGPVRVREKQLRRDRDTGD